jgi:transketolase
MNTTKGHGVNFMQNQMAWHYLPMNEIEYKEALKNIDNL